MEPVLVVHSPTNSHIHKQLLSRIYKGTFEERVKLATLEVGSKPLGSERRMQWMLSHYR
eukprot:SAG25_NODE_14240_length_257_cov_0.955696_1_plen_58_part_10